MFLHNWNDNSPFLSLFWYLVHEIELEISYGGTSAVWVHWSQGDREGGWTKNGEGEENSPRTDFMIHAGDSRRNDWKLSFHGIWWWWLHGERMWNKISVNKVDVV